MSTTGDCIKRDVCIYAKEDVCSDCGHYISDRKFTSTNKRSPKCQASDCSGVAEVYLCRNCDDGEGGGCR